MKKIVALLLAVAMLLTLSACGKKTEEKTPPNPAEVATVAEAFVKAHFQRDYKTKFSLCFYDARKEWEDTAIKEHGTAEAFFEMAQKQADAKGIEASVKSFDDYYASYHNFILQECTDRYGEYSLITTVTGSTKMAADDLPAFRDGLLNGTSKAYMDFDTLNAINEVYTVAVNLTIEGSKNDYNQNYLITIVLHNGQWLVADYTA